MAGPTPGSALIDAAMMVVAGGLMVGRATACSSNGRRSRSSNVTSSP